MNISKYVNSYINIYKYTLSFFNRDYFTLIETSILSAVVILAPTNFFLSWRPAYNYINGHFIDYLSPKIPPSLLLIWLLVMLTAARTRGKDSQKANLGLKKVIPTWLLWLCGWIILRFVFWEWSPSTLWWFGLWLLGPYTFWRWLQWYLESGLSNNKIASKKLSEEKYQHRCWLFTTLHISITGQALVAAWQYITQKSLMGYAFFGEPNFSRRLSLASSAWSCQELILPYGTTPHPNILAGWMVLGLILSLWWARFRGVRFKKNVWWWITTSLYLLVLAWSESWSAIITWWLVLILVYSFHFWPHYFSSIYGFFSTKTRLVSSMIIFQILWVIIPFLPGLFGSKLVSTEPSLARRTHLITVFGQLLEEKWWGVSLREVFLHIFDNEMVVWGSRFLQPVHHSGLFLLTVLGFWVLIVLLKFTSKVQKKYTLFWLIMIAATPIFSLDHYLVTTLSGQFMLNLSLAIFLNYFIIEYPNN